jgi:hypothetical protein
MPDSIKREDELIAKAVRWAAMAAHEIREAGGYSPGVLGMFPDKLIATMVRNNIGVKHLGL